MKVPSRRKDREIIIAGAGSVGSFLASYLVKEDYSVILIEEDKKKLQAIEKRMDIQGVEGNCCDPRVLEQIPIRKGSVFIAVTDSDEVNLVACRVARALGASVLMARVHKPFYKVEERGVFQENFWKKWGIHSLLNQEELSLEEIRYLIETPGASEVIPLEGGRLYLAFYRVYEGSLLCGRRLSGLRDVPLFKDVIALAVTTLGDREKKLSTSKGWLSKIFSQRKIHALRETKTLIPRGDYTIQPGDSLLLCSYRECFPQIAKIFHPELPEGYRKIFILGGDSLLALHIAKNFARYFEEKDVYLILEDKKEAYEAEEELPTHKVRILNIPPSDIDTLLQEGLNQESVFIGASSQEDDNLFFALLIREEVGARSIAIIQNPVYLHVAPYLEIDAVVSPKLLVASSMMRLLQKEGVEIIPLPQESAELFPVKIQKDSFLLGKKIADVKYPSNTLVAYLKRGEEILIPTGETRFLEGDEVFFFHLGEEREEAMSFLQKCT